MLSSRGNNTPAPPQTNKSGPSPLIRLFIDRGNGNLVPLVPADELPNSIHLEEVPRLLSIEDTFGMQHIGKLPFTGQQFKLDPDPAQPTSNFSATRPDINNGALNRFLAPDAHIRQRIENKPSAVSVQMASQSTICQPPASTAAATWRRQDDSTSAKAQATIDAIIALNQRLPTRARQLQTVSKSSHSGGASHRGSPEPAGDKIYCTHWIRHGECDYTQQGCRYRHEMPPDTATLNSIGFRTVPRWWQEKIAVQLGQSSIPKALQRRSSTASDSSYGSESDTDSEASAEDEVSGKAVTTMNDTAPKKRESAGDQSLENNAKVASPEASPSSLTVPSDSCLKLCMTGDLIDFGPLEPESTIPSATSQQASNIAACVSSPSTSSPVPKEQPKQVRKQVPSPPRKVFVPAGESKDFHIAASRKHAQEHEQNLKPSAASPKENAVDANKLAFQRNAALQHTPSTNSLNPTIPKRPDSTTGLMASMHATQPPASKTPVTRQSAPESSIDHSSGPSSKPSRRHPRSKASGPSAKGAEDDGKSQSTQVNKHQPPSACRPRMPARSGAKLQSRNPTATTAKH